MDDGADLHPATGAPARRREARPGQETSDPWRSGHPNLESAAGHSRGRRRRRRQRPTTAPLGDGAAYPDPELCADVARSHPRGGVVRLIRFSTTLPIESDPDPAALCDADVGGASVPDPFIASELVTNRGPRRSAGAGPSLQHPGAERRGTRTRVRQSVLYSDCFRRLPRIPEPTPTEENPGELGSSEAGMAVTDSSKFEALSLSDPSLLTPQKPQESADECSRALSLSDPSFIPQSTKVKPTKDSEADKEESLRLIREYLLENPPTSLHLDLARIKAVEDATLAAKRGTLPPPLRTPLPVDQETQSLQGKDHASAVVAHPERIMPTQPTHEASMEEIIEKGKKWMRDEVMMCFEKYAERRSSVKILEYHLDELCHQCLNVEDYNKVFHHYDFKISMRKSDSVEWTQRLYFAEVKEIFGRKYYFCCPVEPYENGLCYGCLKQGVKDLKHPATGGFEMGFTDATLFGYSEE